MSNGLVDDFVFLDEIENFQSVLESYVFQSNIYREYYKIGSFGIIDVFEQNFKTLQSITPAGEPTALYIIFGELLPRETKNEKLKIKVIVQNYHFEINTVDQSKGFWAIGPDKIWYQLEHPCNSKYQQYFNPILLTPITQNIFPIYQLGNKPSVKMSLFSICDNSMNLVSLIEWDQSKCSSLILTGVLGIESSSELLRVRVNIKSYEYRLNSLSSTIIEKGLWVETTDHLWIHLIGAPEPSYLNYFNVFDKSLQLTQISPYEKPSKNYSEKIFPIKDFIVRNSKEETCNFILPNKIEEMFSVQGKFHLKNFPDISIRVYVNDYLVDVGKKEESTPKLYLRNIREKVLYQLCFPNSGAKSSSLASLLKEYDWPTDDNSDEVWRKLTDFFIFDSVKKVYYNAFFDGNITDALGKGKLLPNPSNDSMQPLKIQFYPEKYSIDYGKSPNDPNKGLWHQDYSGNWYKLMAPPYFEYKELGEEAFYKVKEFLKLYDILIYNPDLVNIDPRNLKVCTKDIQNIYFKSLDNPNIFSLQFIAKHKKFVLDNLTGFNEKKSKILFQSIQKLNLETAIEIEENYSKGGIPPVAKELVLPKYISPTKDSNIPSVTKKVAIKKRKIIDESSDESLDDFNESSHGDSEPLSAKKNQYDIISHNTEIIKKDGVVLHIESSNEPIRKIIPEISSLIKSSITPEGIIATNGSLINNSEIPKRIPKRKLIDIISDEEDVPKKPSKKQEKEHISDFKSIKEEFEKSKLVKPVVESQNLKIAQSKDTKVFCPYCRALPKRHNCTNRNHFDGHPLRISEKIPHQPLESSYSSFNKGDAHNSHGNYGNYGNGSDHQAPRHPRFSDYKERIAHVPNQYGPGPRLVDNRNDFYQSSTNFSQDKYQKTQSYPFDKRNDAFSSNSSKSIDELNIYRPPSLYPPFKSDSLPFKSDNISSFSNKAKVHENYSGKYCLDCHELTKKDNCTYSDHIHGHYISSNSSTIKSESAISTNETNRSNTQQMILVDSERELNLANKLCNFENNYATNNLSPLVFPQESEDVDITFDDITKSNTAHNKGISSNPSVSGGIDVIRLSEKFNIGTKEKMLQRTLSARGGFVKANSANPLSQFPVPSHTTSTSGQDISPINNINFKKSIKWKDVVHGKLCDEYQSDE